MLPLPKIVRQRLQAAPRSHHPDADILTAFAEHLLPDTDRAVLMEHLAHCGECREIIALALPEIVEQGTTVALPRPWLSMPVLRWGAIAAAVVVIVSVGVARYRVHSVENFAKLENTAKPVIAQNSVPAAQEDSGTPKATAPMRTPQTAAPADNSRSRPSNSNAIAMSQPRRAGGIPEGHAIAGADALTANRSAHADFIAENAPPTSPPTTRSETVEVSGASPASAKETSLGLAQSQNLQAPGTHIAQQADKQSGPEEISEDRAVVGKAKDPVAPQVSPAPFQMASATLVSTAGPRWTITPAGGLQRSYDQGKTWQDVPLSANSASSAIALQAESTQLKQKAMGRGEMARSKEKKSYSQLPIIRAISASGSEIWAGAAGGVLYRSIDAGDHWISLIPSEAGVFLTGDIVSVQFSGTLVGKVTTSTSENWITTDGGQTWSRQ